MQHPGNGRRKGVSAKWLPIVVSLVFLQLLGMAEGTTQRRPRPHQQQQQQRAQLHPSDLHPLDLESNYPDLHTFNFHVGAAGYREMKSLQRRTSEHQRNHHHNPDHQHHHNTNHQQHHHNTNHHQHHHHNTNHHHLNHQHHHSPNFHHNHNQQQHQYTEETFPQPLSFTRRRFDESARGFAFRAGRDGGVDVFPVGGKEPPRVKGLEVPKEAAVRPPPGPTFDATMPKNMTFQAGKMALLSCRVFNINDKSVSWIRLDDLHILTVDKYKYSTDQRVSVIFNEPNLEWVLRIKSVSPEDEGRYECQVSTKPVLSYIVNMKVVVPRAWILNAPEIHVHRGSPINLTCIVSHGTERPVFIYWYHDHKVIDYDGRGGVTVQTQTTKDTVSHLLVQEAGLTDSGKYTCSPSNGEEASVRLHVLSGEFQAAMQTNRGASTRLSCPARHALATLLLAALAWLTLP